MATTAATRSSRTTGRTAATLLDSIADAVLAIDADLRISWCNAGTERLVQRTQEQTIGQSVSSFIAPDHRDDIARVERLLTSGLPVRDFETVLRRTDGSDVVIAVSITSECDDTGGPTGGAIAIVRDISDQVRAADVAGVQATRTASAERRAFDAATERAGAEQANEAKTALLARLSHDMRTPLNSMLGFAQLLTSAELVDPADRYSAEQILEAGDRLLQLVDEMLAVTRAADADRRSSTGWPWDVPTDEDRSAAAPRAIR